MSDESWDGAAPRLAEGVLEEGTIMEGGCVRSGSHLLCESNFFVKH